MTPKSSAHQSAEGRGSEEHSSSGPPHYLAVARILRPWGVRGWVKVESLTDFPQRFQQPGVYFLGDEKLSLQLEQGRLHRGSWLLKFAGLDAPEAWEPLRDQLLYVPLEAAMPLGEDEYWVHEIIGLHVRTETGELLGTIVDVWETGANDVYVVQAKDIQILLPAIRQVIREIDLQQGVMTVHLLEGLIP